MSDPNSSVLMVVRSHRCCNCCWPGSYGREFPGEEPGPWVFLHLSPSWIPTGNDSFEMFELFVDDNDFHELYFVFLCHDCVVLECVCEYWESKLLLRLAGTKNRQQNLFGSGTFSFLKKKSWKPHPSPGPGCVCWHRNVGVCWNLGYVGNGTAYLDPHENQASAVWPRAAKCCCSGVSPWFVTHNSSVLSLPPPVPAGGHVLCSVRTLSRFGDSQTPSC